MSDGLTPISFGRMDPRQTVITRDTQSSVSIAFALSATNAEDHVNFILTIPNEGKLNDVRHVYLFEKGRRVRLWIPLPLSVEEHRKSVQWTLPSDLVEDVFLVIACKDNRGDTEPPIPDPCFLSMFYDRVYEVQIKSFVPISDPKHVDSAERVNVTIDLPQQQEKP